MQSYYVYLLLVLFSFGSNSIFTRGDLPSMLAMQPVTIKQNLQNPSTISIIRNQIFVTNRVSNIVMLNISTPSFTVSSSITLTSGDIYGCTAYQQENTTKIYVSRTDPSPGFYQFVEPFTEHQISSFNFSYSGLQQPYPVTIDSIRGYLYTIDFSAGVVAQFDLINPTTARFTITSLANHFPTKVILGCKGDLFIVTRDYNKVFHFPLNSNSYDYSFGQGYNDSSLNLDLPIGGAFNQDCSLLWITDSGNSRILKYSTPFGPNTTPIQTFMDTSLLSNPYDLALDYDNNRMWIVDYSSNQILSIITKLYPDYVILNCLQNNIQDPNLCIISTPIIVGDSILQFNYTNIQTSSTILFSPSSQTLFSSNQTITSSSTITFAGNFTLFLPASLLPYQGV
eukprot:TRINITY_DN4086_c0_g1_i1.p1 TRINITY_DN4086_c0_g1~~TRINITY_DN4086_c0_g1_i1.p1  ORF type:complete len:396 (+),score=62.50 TRINITY_DN4086_c0_g1_i1:33-1220(+)